MPDWDARDFVRQAVVAANDNRGGRPPPGAGLRLEDTGTGLVAANRGPPADRDRTAVAVTAIITAALTLVALAALAMLQPATDQPRDAGSLEAPHLAGE